MRVWAAGGLGAALRQGFETSTVRLAGGWKVRQTGTRLMTPFNTNTRPLSVLLHAILGSVAAIGISTALLNPPSLRADVAKGSEKPKKDPDDKKKEKKTDYLPEARAAIGRFLVGGSVDIELVASVGTSRRVEFVVRQAPKCGTLSLIRPDLTEGHKARVTYTHDGGGAPLSDSFTYAYRDSTSGQLTDGVGAVLQCVEDLPPRPVTQRIEDYSVRTHLP